MALGLVSPAGVPGWLRVPKSSRRRKFQFFFFQFFVCVTSGDVPLAKGKYIAKSQIRKAFIFIMKDYKYKKGIIQAMFSNNVLPALNSLDHIL